MKYLLILTLFLSGCNTVKNLTSNDEPNITMGQSVLVKKGFYKDCAGIVTDKLYKSYKIVNVVCPKATLDWTFVDSEDLVE